VIASFEAPAGAALSSKKIGALTERLFSSQWPAHRDSPVGGKSQSRNLN